MESKRSKLGEREDTTKRESGLEEVKGVNRVYHYSTRTMKERQRISIHAKGYLSTYKVSDGQTKVWQANHATCNRMQITRFTRSFFKLRTIDIPQELDNMTMYIACPCSRRGYTDRIHLKNV